MPPLIGYTGQMWVPFLTVAAHHTAVVVGVLPQEALSVVAAVNVDLGKCVMSGRLLTAFLTPELKPGK